jgi:hypothetical protein
VDFTWGTSRVQPTTLTRTHSNRTQPYWIESSCETCSTSRRKKLALSCQLTNAPNVPTGASLVWRDRLGYTEDFATRLATAHDLLCQGHGQLDYRTRRFRDSPEGMRLVVEKASEIRERGDRVAHQTPPTRKIYHGAFTRFDDIAEFVCV